MCEQLMHSMLFDNDHFSLENFSSQLLTPMNCITNVSERLIKDASTDFKKATSQREECAAELENDAGLRKELQHKLEKTHKKVITSETIWGSAKMLQFIMHSMINRIRFQGSEKLLKLQSRGQSGLLRAIDQVIKPFKI